MNLVPKRGFAKISIKSTEDPMDVDIDDGERILSASYPVDDGSECPSETVGSAAVIDVPDPEITCLQYLSDPSHNAAIDASGPSKMMQRGKGTGVKTRKPELSLTLVHGDAVILDGDDFEVSYDMIGFSSATADEYVSAKSSAVELRFVSIFELKGFLISKVKMILTWLVLIGYCE
jgi:hypothetical protein